MSTTPEEPGTDRHLLFGILAVQLDFITQDALINAMHAWLLNKTQPLAQILVDQGSLAPHRFPLLETLIEEHIRQHGNDAQQSLAAVGSAGSACRALALVADPDVQASLARVSIKGPGEQESCAVRSGYPVAWRFQTLVTGLAAVLLVGASILAVVIILLDADNKELQTATWLAQTTAHEAEQARQEEQTLRGLADQRATELDEQTGRLAWISGFAADSAWEAGHAEQALDFLLAIPPERRAWEWRYRHRLFQGSYLTLYGHTDFVTSVAFSPDGQRLASASQDKTVRLWDAVSGLPLLTLSGHTGFVGSLVFSADGQRLATASYDHTVRLWEVVSGRHLLTLNGHANWVTSVAFSPDGKRLATASLDDTVRLWDAENGRDLLTFKGHSLPVMSVAFSPDGQRLATASVDETLRLWEVHSGRDLLTLSGHTGPVWSVAFSPDGKRLASGSNDTTARLWDAVTGRDLLTLSGHNRDVLRVAFGPDGQRLATASADESVRLWDASSGRHLLTLNGHLGPVNSVAFSPDSQRLASGSDDDTVRLWEARAGRHLLALTGHAGEVSGVAYSPDGQRLATASADKTVRLWEAVSGRQLLTLYGHADRVRSVVFSPGGHRLATASNDKTVRLWEAGSGRHLLTLAGHTDAVAAVVFSPDGQRLATASQDKTVRLWEARSGRHLLTLKGHTGPVWSVAYSPDGQRLASASSDMTVRLWEVESGRQLRILKGHTDQVLSVAFSPDGKRLATGSEDKTVRLWEASSGRDLLTLTGHTQPVASVVFSADGRRLATASHDGTVRLWEADSGRHLLTLSGHTEGVTSVAFSPDGEQLATGSGDETARLWEAGGGRHVHALTGHTNTITSVNFSPKGNRLFTRDRQGTVLAWDVQTGNRLPAPQDAPVLGAGLAMQHPTRSLLALATGNRIDVVDTRPATAQERAFREGMARFDLGWHRERAEANEQGQHGFAAAFHWGQLAEREPGYDLYWQKLETAWAALGDWRPARMLCDRLLHGDAGRAPLYVRRARLRGCGLEFYEASADMLVGLTLATRQPIGWPDLARGAAAHGDERAAQADWPGACRAFADAAAWEQQNPWHLHRLAWAQLAAGQPDAFRATCRGLFEDYRSTRDVAQHYQVLTDLGLGLSPGASLLRGMGRPTAEAILQNMQASRNDAIVWTACVVADHGLPAADMVVLASRNAQQSPTADYLEALGAAQYRAGQYAEAITQLQKAVKLHAQDGSNGMRLFLAMAYQQQQQPDQARQWLGKAQLGDQSTWAERLAYARLRAEASRLLKSDE